MPLTILQFGEIIDIRFPSLKYNTHRRFCYIQFKTADQATAATQVDGESVGPNLSLVAKISAPNRRQDRSGALQEGREIHIVNLDWAVTELELEDLFSKYGKVERVRIPTALSGKSKGFAFVTFSKKVCLAASQQILVQLIVFYRRRPQQRLI